MQKIKTPRARLLRAAPRVRRAEEFASSAAAARPPAERSHMGSAWTLEQIRAARNDQMSGQFRVPVQLARSLRADDAIATARSTRLLPLSSVATRLAPVASARGEAVAKRAQRGVFAPRSVLAGMHATLVDHGIAVGYLDHGVNGPGTLTTVRLREWPLEFVRWNRTREALEARTSDGQTLDVVHGDGRWVVAQKFADQPWAQDAAILPAAYVGFMHSDVLADWGNASRAHGLARMIGEMPEGVPLLDEGGNVHPSAQAFLELMQELASGDANAGVRPPGAKTEFLANGSSAWQVFAEGATSREKAAARIYLGTDAVLGSVGGAPGVDIAELFKIASSKIQSDFSALESALNVGAYQPWTAINHGTSALAPRFEFVVPDADEDHKHEQAAADEERLAFALERRKALGLVVDQHVVDVLAEKFGVHPPPRIA